MTEPIPHTRRDDNDDPYVDDVGSTLDLTPLSDVLVVDDEPHNLTAIEAILDTLNVRTTSTGSGEEGLRHLLEHDFAVILLDVKMPGLDGFETARLIRSRARNRLVPIIFMTAYSPGEADVRRAYGIGAVDYLFKPIVPEILCAKVKVFVDLRERTAEVARQAERLRQVERRESLRQLENERRRWEAEALRTQVRQERHAKEMLAELDRRKDEFIALLAHELRNPLVPLVLGFRTLRLCDPTSEEARTTRERMERQVDHLTRLVADLTDVARIDHGKLQLDRRPLELGPLVEEAVEMRRPDLEGQKLRIEGSEESVVVNADPVRLTQVVSNLLGNAIRYSGPNTEIVVRWGTERGHAIVSVADQGRGIAPEFLQRVFLSFAQERDSGRGLGLGLTVVRQLVELHGGTVEAHSEGLGHGSEFIVRLPIVTGAEALAPPRPTDVASPPARSMRVAIVEDDPDIRAVVSSLLRQWGHELVGEAGTGPTGVDLLVSTRPDVALVDIGLPELDGHSVAERVRDALGADCPRLIAMTGFDHAEGEGGAFDQMLTKPPEVDALAAALTSVEPREGEGSEGSAE